MTSEPTDPKRQAILNGATRMFLAHGYRNVSMEKIAQAAPVSKATLYNHFDSKNALLAAVISDLCESLLQTMTQATIESDDVENNLTQIATSAVDLIYAEDALAIYRLVVAESPDFPELGQLFYQSGPQTVLTQLEDYFRRLNADGRYHIADPVFAADAFFSMLKGDLHLRCLLTKTLRPSADEKKQLISKVIAFYMRGMLHAKP
ncbi:MAG: TetR/AcrR family transcriptional regulator [Methylobacter sp.]|uniref:TetR/AcrR family transcriptional regulator n=1 Tax=Methylobacter sp. TaxID=2051955 RepID=UPI0027315FA2|nr:TetR/AcrR family transcriptional regulator [Methylobacter sp.]MDP1666990.1 TetR/AcrR family transcriptional regulator [Methylobacter sp.]MDP1970796.1 TetR/AcrR family transcriptional regulator [Methylobacter sp.]